MPDRAAIAARWDMQLRHGSLPFWLATVDRRCGGYRLDGRDLPRGPLRAAGARLRERIPRRLGGRSPAPAEKHVVSQTRLVWVFSLTHRLGYGDACREAAEHGYAFLLDRLLDPEHGGLYWRADLAGRVIDPRKTLYGQAFGVYALVEHHRATGREEPLTLARRIFDVVQARLHEASGGWREHGGRDFTPLAEPRGATLPGLVDRVGLQSANGHLHWMEALSELLDVTGAPDVRAALIEALEVCRAFFAREPARCARYRSPEGTLIDAGKLNYGHNVEFAWLMVRAQHVLEKAPDWELFDALVRHALAHGFDHRRGGFFDSGVGDGPPTNRRKVWWVQAEALAALIEGLARGPDPDYDRALDLHLQWIARWQRAPDGVWIASTSPRGRVRSPVKEGSWKAGYHEVRAETKLIEAYGPARGTAPRTRPASPRG